MPHSNIQPKVRERAGRIRKDRAHGEKPMQEYLRSLRPYGARFRRETPIGPYIVDFAWLTARIVIEVDGASHDLPGRAERDAERDLFLRSQGFRVIRVRDADAIANSAKAFAQIEEAVRPRLRAPPRTPPHNGEGSIDAPAKPSAV